MSFKRGLAEDEEDWQIAREAVICEGKVNGKGWPEAIAKFQEAKTLDSSLEFDPEAKAKSLVVPALVKKGVELMEKDHATEALGKYKEAQELDSNLKQADKWNLNSLCWCGSLRGYAAEVMSACEMALKRDPNDGYIRDSWGVRCYWVLCGGNFRF